MRSMDDLNSLTNVAPGSRAVLNMSIGRTYDRAFLELTDIVASEVKNLRLQIDSKPVQEYLTLADLLTMNKYYGRHDDAERISMWFARPEFEDLNMQRVTAVGTGLSGEGVVGTMQMMMDIDAGADVGLAIQAAAIQSDPKPLGMITKVKYFHVSSAVAGILQVHDLPRGPRIFAIHVVSNNVASLELKQNSFTIRKGSKARIDFVNREGGRVPQAGWTTIDFTTDRDLWNSLETRPDVVRDMLLNIELSAPGGVGIYIEYLDNYAGI